jgi:septal ring factor EnvC (AmiA/AmiB activator)
MSSAMQSRINRLAKDIADLRKADAQEAKKEADLLGKLNRANEAAGRSKSSSTVQSKLREMERASKDLASVQKKRADLAGKIADKSKSLRSYEANQASDDEKARKKVADEQKRLIKEREAHERRLASDMRRRASSVNAGTGLTEVQEAHDFFISHASEDKDGFVRDLAEVLNTNSR